MLEDEIKSLSQQKRSSDNVGDKVGDMDKIANQQKRSFDKIRDNVGDKYLFIP